MTDLVSADDVRDAADLCVATLQSVADRDWSVRTVGLEWTAADTLFHLSRVPTNYAVHLATRATSASLFRIGRIDNRSGGPAKPAALLSATRAYSYILADVIGAAPPEARAFHQMGMADRSGFAAMTCDELLIHTDDLARTFDVAFSPPLDLVSRVLARLFPWAPSDAGPWEALRWANGRQELPGYPRQGPDWTWHCAPLDEWNGTA